MLISFHADSVQDSLLLAPSGLYRGASPLDVILAMKRASAFGDDTPLAYYLDYQVGRLKRRHGVTLTLAGLPPDAQAAALLDAFIAHRVVQVLSDALDATEGDPQCAD
jgi:hypothetical protein